MQATNHTKPDSPPGEDLAKLHETANAKRDMPLTKERDARPLPADTAVDAENTEPKPLPRAGAT